MTHPDRVYSRSQLLDRVWGANVYVEERTVDVHVRRLRKALADHGELGDTLSPDGGDAEKVLGQFGKAGIDVDALAARLQEEGAASFVKSWNELLEVIASRRSALTKTG